MEDVLEDIGSHLCHAVVFQAAGSRGILSASDATTILRSSFLYSLSAWTFASRSMKLKGYQTGQDIISSYTGRQTDNFAGLEEKWADLKEYRYGTVLYERERYPTWLFVCLYSADRQLLRETIGKILSLIRFTAPFGILPIVSLHVVIPNGYETDIGEEALKITDDITALDDFFTGNWFPKALTRVGRYDFPDDVAVPESTVDWCTGQPITHYQTVNLLWDIRDRLNPVI
ncbi:MAG: hypothetical protein CMF31_06305 [Kordiimonas sp.]|nr:hypothetical protein [Kordiimonas sp.]|tara:strand:+ start:1448 stop:2137 length:690 start_codon:yes stop_codon:yes gene_type:complete